MVVYGFLAPPGLPQGGGDAYSCNCFAMRSCFCLLSSLTPEFVGAGAETQRRWFYVLM